MYNVISILSSFILVVSSVPHWEDLQCEDGHKYLFSEVSLTWDEAVGECSLYAGWLVALNSLQEQNCLLKHAQNEGLTEDWYWTDGNSQRNFLIYDFDDMWQPLMPRPRECLSTRPLRRRWRGCTPGGVVTPPPTPATTIFSSGSSAPATPRTLGSGVTGYQRSPHTSYARLSSDLWSCQSY